VLLCTVSQPALAQAGGVGHYSPTGVHAGGVGLAPGVGRIRDAARNAETYNDPASFERAFAAVARGAQKTKKGAPEKR
jgi:hypothetical protein